MKILKNKVILTFYVYVKIYSEIVKIRLIVRDIEYTDRHVGLMMRILSTHKISSRVFFN